jgi:hypothetical protein
MVMSEETETKAEDIVADEAAEAAEDTSAAGDAPLPDDAPSPSPAEVAGSPKKSDALELTGDETVTFDNKVFSRMEGSYFRKSEQEDAPVFVVNLGGEEVTLPFTGLCREFGIEANSHDDKMLHMIAQSLDFVKFLLIGDAIPKEILTGEASWEVSDEHRRIAYQRLSMQLVTWMTGGDELQVTDPEQLLQIAEDPATKAKISEAFGAAAESLGYGKDQREVVIERIEELAEEIAFIETLREKYRDVLVMDEKLKKLKAVFGRERSVQDLITPVSRLVVVARDEFEMSFDEIDAQTGEIIGVLKNLKAQKAYIRESRDEIYKRLMAWEDLLASWRKEPVGKSRAIIDLIRETYQFLAPRFMRADEWKLSAHLHDKPGDDSTEVVW